jgi:hypothetical protein
VSGLKKGFPNLTHLIQSIQRIEGKPDCFGKANGYCDQKECVWYNYCLGKIEGLSAASDRHPDTDSKNEFPDNHQKNKNSQVPFFANQDTWK